ncbi:hypothetical protein DFH06DRAFT_1371713 [Mycena polygramma]|nr:hypothetical protein DFH06DRAFT_1371713 [Mycena polygramma]
MAIICTHCGHLNLTSSLDSLTRNGVHSRLDLPASNLRAYVADIRAEISRHKNDLQLLEAKERQLESALARVVYPVLTLPTEIVSMIFVHCLPAHGRVRPSPRKAPLLLAQICSLWRGIALSTGSLWASVDIRFRCGYVQRYTYGGSEFGDIPNPGALPLIKAWFSRAKGSPLSVTLRSNHKKLSQHFLSLIPSYAHQIQCLELSLTPADFDHLRGACVEFPALRDLALACHQLPISADNPVSIFGNPPFLRQMCILYDVHSTAPFGVYESLTTLTLKTISVPIALGVIAYCARLLHLTIELQDPLDHHLTLEPPRILELHSLTVRVSDDFGPCAPLLDIITLPKLRHLELRHALQFDTLQSFLTRSGCILDHLGLGISTDGEARREIPTILRMFPSLTSLHIRTGPHIETVVRLLGIVPELRALTLTTTNRNLDYDNLLFFLEHRRILELYPVLLHSFHLKILASELNRPALFPPDTVLHRFSYLMGDGLDILASTAERCWPFERMCRDRCAHFPEQEGYLAEEWPTP